MHSVDAHDHLMTTGLVDLKITSPYSTKERAKTLLREVKIRFGFIDGARILTQIDSISFGQDCVFCSDLRCPQPPFEISQVHAHLPKPNCPAG